MDMATEIHWDRRIRRIRIVSGTLSLFIAYMAAWAVYLNMAEYNNTIAVRGCIVAVPVNLAVAWWQLWRRRKW